MHLCTSTFIAALGLELGLSYLRAPRYGSTGEIAYFSFYWLNTRGHANGRERDGERRKPHGKHIPSVKQHKISTETFTRSLFCSLSLSFFATQSMRSRFGRISDKFKYKKETSCTSGVPTVGRFICRRYIDLAFSLSLARAAGDKSARRWKFRDFTRRTLCSQTENASNYSSK